MNTQKAQKENNRSIEKEFFGQKYRFKTQEGQESTREVFELVEKIIHKNTEKYLSHSPNQILILSMLELGGEYVKSKKKVSIHREELEESLIEIERILQK